jgi:NTP pyrophosphatase (non-canonical NTP hydrolase)
MEDQLSIAKWADETFGPVSDWTTAAERAGQEMSEFLVLIYKQGNPEDFKGEAADIVVTLYRLAAVLGFDLHEEVDKKMAINRERKWISYGNGHGHHQ